jgi:hypothetical protein
VWTVLSTGCGCTSAAISLSAYSFGWGNSR